MDLEVRTPLYRYPQAEAVRDGTGWGVRLRGRGQPVVPRGVLLGGAHAEAEVLPHTLHETVRHLAALDSIADDRAAAEHLRDHVRTYAVPAEDPSEDATSRARIVELDQVRLYAAALAAVSRAVDATWLRQPLPQRYTIYLMGLGGEKAETPTGWPGGDIRLFFPVRLIWSKPDLVPPIEHGSTPVESKHGTALRSLVEESINALFAAGDVRPVMRWIHGRGPTIVLSSGTPLGLYALDLATGAGRGPASADHVCDVCGQPIDPKRPPRPGEGKYCRSPECQKERQRRNKARHRAKARAEAPQ